jgi:hypothetical protein
MAISSSYLVGVLILFDLFGVSRLILGQSGGVLFWIEVIIRVVVVGLIFSIIERCRRKLTERTRPSRAQVFLSAAAGAVAPYVAVMTSAGMIGNGRNYPGSLTQRVVVGVVGGIALALLYGWIAMADDTRRRRRKAALPAVPGRRP